MNSSFGTPTGCQGIGRCGLYMISLMTTGPTAAVLLAAPGVSLVKRGKSPCSQLLPTRPKVPNVPMAPNCCSMRNPPGAPANPGEERYTASPSLLKPKLGSSTMYPPAGTIVDMAICCLVRFERESL